MAIVKNILILSTILSTLACLIVNVAAANFNVLDFGAKGDGHADDSQAFGKAWGAACAAVDAPTITVPTGKNFLVNPIEFNGPCKARNVFVTILGTLLAPPTPSTWKNKDPSKWLTFKGVNGLRISGSGTLNGQGKAWWDQSCRDHPNLAGCTKLSPTSLNFLSCNDTGLRELHFINSPQTHILIMGCSLFHVRDVHINSPETSPNTDGLHMQFAQHVTIENSEFHSGDDCVSIGDKCSDIKVNSVQCGPGHGISIGSLGGGGNFVEVEDIHVYDVHFVKTTNGVRIKTYQVGTGYCRNVSFKKLTFTEVANPIIIDQYYCAKAGACSATKTGVKVSDITYENAIGTTTSELAINLNCSNVVACSGLTFNNIQLSPAGKIKQVRSNCVNSIGKTIGPIKPDLNCLNQHGTSHEL